MSLPPIEPTGAMSSGDYVTYMIGYLDSAMDDIMDSLDSYLGEVQLDAWSAQWNRQVTDLTEQVSDLSSRLSKVTSKVRMAGDAISNL